MSKLKNFCQDLKDHASFFKVACIENIKYAGGCAIDGIKDIPEKLRSFFCKQSIEDITGKTPIEQIDDLYGTHNYAQEQVDTWIKEHGNG